MALQERERKASYWWKKRDCATTVVPPRYREGATCPSCREGTLVYDPLFNLSCPRCHYVAESGASY